MLLKDLLEKFSWKAIEKNCKQMNLRKTEILKIHDAWKQLKKLDVESNIETIEINMDVDGFYFLKETKMHVYGQNANEEEIDLSFYDWKEWLNFKINEYLKYVISEIDILIHCVREMLTWGLNRERVLINTKNNLNLFDPLNLNLERDNVIYLFN